MLAVNILISVFGVASAFSPNYYVLLLLRGIVGFGIGGGILGYVICGTGVWYEKLLFTILSTTYCTEFIPTRWRAVVLFILEVSFLFIDHLYLKFVVLVLLGARYYV